MELQTRDEGNKPSNGIIALIVILVGGALCAVGGWIAFTQIRARSLGLPPPSLSSYIPFKGGRSSASRNYPASTSGGIAGWFRSLTNRRNRTAGGAYEERGRAGRGGIGAADPDEAWDARVGHEADSYGPGGYYEEQELGLHEPSSTAYGGAAARASAGATASYLHEPSSHADSDPPRGRSQSRDPPNPFIGGEEMQPGQGAKLNPFDDGAERSNMPLRDLSPRPLGAEAGHRPSSIDSERRSIFHEEV
ncbi:MAG: hypothetical protein M1829_002975 [Trizodia sp. TS-e1964]|nr:MAG: hypothetical protein M1829_002975 [Trizodia sp. TS-e1964]